MHCQTDYQFSSDTCGLSCKFWRSREESRGGTNSFTYPLCLHHTTVIVFKTQMPFTIGLGSVHRGQAFRIVDTGNSKRCHRLEKLKYSPPVGMRLRVSSSTNLCRLRTVTSASETEAETDCETGLLPEVSPQTLIEMERVRNSKDDSTSATPPLSGHRRTIKVMGLPLSPELVAISLGTVLQPRAVPMPHDLNGCV